MRQELFAPAHLLETLESTRNDSSASRKHGGDPRGSRCWPRRSLPTHHSTFASKGPGGERATRGAIGACSVDHRGESWRTRSSATMKDATHVMAEAVLSEPRPAKDHESLTEP